MPLIYNSNSTGILSPSITPVNKTVLSTFLTIRTLKQQTLTLLNKEMLAELQQKLNTFLKGSVAQATTAILVLDQLQKTKAAQNE